LPLAPDTAVAPADLEQARRENSDSIKQLRQALESHPYFTHLASERQGEVLGIVTDLRCDGLLASPRVMAERAGFKGKIWRLIYEISCDHVHSSSSAVYTTESSLATADPLITIEPMIYAVMFAMAYMSMWFVELFPYTKRSLSNNKRSLIRTFVGEQYEGDVQRR